MNKYTFFWRDGHIDVVEGENADEAYKSLDKKYDSLIGDDGLAFYMDGDGADKFIWNEKDKFWMRK